MAKRKISLRLEQDRKFPAPSVAATFSVKQQVMRMDLLRIIHDNLAVPRDRLGRLDYSAGTPEAERGRVAREELRQLAVLLGVGGCRDTMDQIAKIIEKAILENKHG